MRHTLDARNCLGPTEHTARSKTPRNNWALCLLRTTDGSHLCVGRHGSSPRRPSPVLLLCSPHWNSMKSSKNPHGAVIRFGKASLSGPPCPPPFSRKGPPSPRVVQASGGLDRPSLASRVVISISTGFFKCGFTRRQLPDMRRRPPPPAWVFLGNCLLRNAEVTGPMGGGGGLRGPSLSLLLLHV